MKEMFAKEKNKRNMIIAAVFAIAAVVFWIVVGGSDKESVEVVEEPKINIIDEEATLADGFKTQFGSELLKLQKDVAEIDNKSTKLQSETELLKSENARLKEELESSTESNSLMFPPADDIRFSGDPGIGVIPPSADGAAEIPPPQVIVLQGLISVGSPLNTKINSADTPEVAKTSELNEAEDLIIPAGSFVKGSLLSGVTAPTMGKATSDPVPSLIRVTGITQLPNFFKADIKECFVLAETKASLATELVSFRLKTLSCKTENGKTLERSIDGYVAGENGMEGMHGRVVSKQATILGRTFIAEFLSGLSKAFGDSTKNIIASPAGTLTTVAPDKALESGAWAGAAGATNRLAEFYMDLANEMVPVIEINAGRNVDLVFIKSINLSNNKESK